MLPSLRGIASKMIESYHRLTWSPLFQSSCLFVADPGLSLHESVRGTWFQGGKDFFSIDRVAHDIRAISDEFGFSEKQTILYGSSQGGYVALALGAYLPGAKILAECPQTDIRLFDLKNDTNRAAKYCYGVDAIEDVPEEYEHRLNIAALYKKVGFTPKSRILVKETDTHCIDIHARPLEEATAGRAHVHIFDGPIGEGGHSALPKETVFDEINALLP